MFPSFFFRAGVVISLLTAGGYCAHADAFDSKPFFLGSKPGRCALVIGNQTYYPAVGPLANPRNDAEAMKDKLLSLGFHVFGGLTLNQVEEIGVSWFKNCDKAPDGSKILIIYYAGHAIQYMNENYIVPVDYNLETQTLNQKDCTLGGLYSISTLLREILRAQVNNEDISTILFLDACRTRPDSAKRIIDSETRQISLPKAADSRAGRTMSPDSCACQVSKEAKPGLAIQKDFQSQSRNLIVSFATAAGDVAGDGSGGHSPYAQALLANLREIGLSIDEVIDKTSADVSAADPSQVPWKSGNMKRPIYLRPASPP